MLSPRHILRLVAVAIALCAAADASAAGRARLSIGGVRKDTGGAVATQLAASVCGAFECVPAARVKRAGALNFEAVKAERVSGVLFGTVAASRGKRNLELALLTTSLTPRRTWVLPLDANGRLAKRDLDRVLADLQAQLGGQGSAAAATPPARTTAPPARTSPAPVAPPQAVEAPRARAEAAPPSSPPTADKPARTTRSPRPAAEPAPRASGDRRAYTRPPWGMLDAGLRLTRRELSYSGVGSGTGVLEKFKADGIVSPGVRLELYPVALAGAEGWPARLAVLGSYSTSVGFKAEETARAGVKHSASLTQLELGAGYRLPLGGSGASLLPRITWRKLSLEVKAAQGATIAGLPDADLSGPSFGLDADVPVSGRWGVFAGASYTVWTTAKDLVGGSPKFFPSGSASAVDLDGGVSVDVMGPLSLRVALEWSRTSYSLKGTSSYAATGATDSYLGGSAMLRLKF